MTWNVDLVADLVTKLVPIPVPNRASDFMSTLLYYLICLKLAFNDNFAILHYLWMTFTFLHFAFISKNHFPNYRFFPRFSPKKH